MFNFIIKIDSYYSKFITSLLVINVITLIFLACYSIISRWAQWTNLWVDPLNRHLVLLLIFLGSTVAIEKKKHLKIDALHLTFEHKISEYSQKYIEIFFHLLTAAILFFLLKSGLNFWLSELEFPVDAFLGLQQYHLVIIIPLGFAFMLKKYIFLLLRNIFELFLLKRKL